MKKSLIVFWGFIFLFVLGGCEVERGKEVVESGSGESVANVIKKQNSIKIKNHTINNLNEDGNTIKEEKWHWNENKKYSVKFKFPQKLNFNSSDTFVETARLDSISEENDIRVSISISDAHPVDFCGDMGCYNFPDEFRKKLLEDKSCEVLNSEITLSSPIYFKSGKPYLCDIFVDEKKGQIALYALGVDNVYGENLTGMIYIAMDDRSVLLRGQGLVLAQYRDYISKKLQRMSQNGDKITITETFVQIRPTNEEIQEFLSQENMDFIKKIVESIDARNINQKLHVYDENYITEEVLLDNNEQYAKTLESLSNLNYYKKYTNNKLGISFVYMGEPESYIYEDNGKLQFIAYNTYYNSDNKYLPNSQDYIEIYEKNTEESFENAVKRIMLEQIDSLEDCNLKIEEQEDGVQKLFVTYQEGFVYNGNTCTQEEIESEGPSCHYRQIRKHDQKATNSCSNFEKSGWLNYFIYQPNKTKNKIVFRRHVSGLDAEPWDVESIELFD